MVQAHNSSAQMIWITEGMNNYRNNLFSSCFPLDKIGTSVLNDKTTIGDEKHLRGCKFNHLKKEQYNMLKINYLQRFPKPETFAI